MLLHNSNTISDRLLNISCHLLLPVSGEGCQSVIRSSVSQSKSPSGFTSIHKSQTFETKPSRKPLACWVRKELENAYVAISKAIK